MLLFVSSISYIANFANLSYSTELPTNYPLVFVYPEVVTAEIGETFTVSVLVYNLTDATVKDPENPVSRIDLGNLYGFDIQFSWDPTVIRYVNYTNPGTGIKAGDAEAKGYKHINVTVPVEKYPNPIPPSSYSGALHGFGTGNMTVMEFTSIVNETGGFNGAADPSVRAWFSYSTMYPAEAFNCNGTGATLFTMTFKVLKKGESPLEIVSCTLASEGGNLIGQTLNFNWLNSPRNGLFRLGAPVADFSFWPDIGVVNKMVRFDASVSENFSVVETYMWDFGDGTKDNTTIPTVEHIYTTAGNRTTSLKVVDADGVESAVVKKQFIVARSRDLKATSITFIQNTIRPNNTLEINARIDNLGLGVGAGSEFTEASIVAIYHNVSLVDLQNPQYASWVLLNTSQILVRNLAYKVVQYLFNSSLLPTIEADYYFLLNVTGIPEGYEADTTNNIKLSNALRYTNETVHSAEITSFNYGYLRTGALGSPKPPVIAGENSTFHITIKNNGTESDYFNVTLYANSSIIMTGETSVLQPGATETIKWYYLLNPGYHNLTVEAKVVNFTVTRSANMKVLKTPLLVVEYTPESPLINQEVTFNASGSIHNEPSAAITDYSWRIFKPGDDPASASYFAKFSGPDVVAISYSFNLTGVWTIVLDVTDNNGFTFDTKRESTSAYRKIIEVTVGEAGFPLEWIIAFVVVIIVAIVAVMVVLLRRRRPKIPAE